MKCSSLAWAKLRHRSSYENQNEAPVTQDGSIDVHGRPASRRTTGGWRGAIFCLTLQTMSATAMNAISLNLVLYLSTVMHQSNHSAAQNVNNLLGTGYFAPLIMAIIADSYIGRFKGAVISAAIEITGLVMLTVAGSLHALHPPQCPTKDSSCEKATAGQGAYLFASLYVTILGQGMLYSTILTMGADQFDEEDEKEKYQKNTFFTVNIVGYLVGGLIAATMFVYLQDHVSVGLSWGLGGILVVFGAVVFLSGRRLYRYQKPVREGNLVLRIAQVIVASSRKMNVKVVSSEDMHESPELDSESGIKLDRKTKQISKFRFLDKAAVLAENDKAGGDQAFQNRWRVCTVTQVEEVKFLLSVFPIFISCIVFSVCYSQVMTLFVEEAKSMDCRLGSFTIPPASIGVFECFSVFIAAYFYDRLLVPYLRKRTGNPAGMSHLKRIAIGLSLCVLAMITAAVVDRLRVHTARDHGLLGVDAAFVPIPMSIFYLVPQYFLVGAGEVFALVGLVEFLYDEAPGYIRCVATSLELITVSLGYFVGTLLLSIVRSITKRDGKPGWIADNLNQARLDLFYWLLAVMSFISLLVFLFFAWRYEYQRFKESSDELDRTVGLHSENGGEDSKQIECQTQKIKDAQIYRCTVKSISDFFK